MVDTIGVTSPFGSRIRGWRMHRSWSQLQLAIAADTTSRHVSFLETGRSRPSATMIERLCDALEVPLRERNALFEAGGFAGPYRGGDIDEPDLEPFRFALASMLEAHLPFPGFAFDRSWNVVMTNVAAEPMFEGTDRNLIRMIFCGPWRDSIDNWDAVAWTVLQRLQADAVDDPSNDELAELVATARSAVTETPRPTALGSDLVVCPRFRFGETLIPTVTVTARFGTSRRTSVDELRVELIFPETDEGRRFFGSSGPVASRPDPDPL